MLRQNNFSKVFGVKTWLAMSQNGRFQIDSAIYKDKNNRKMYTYFDSKNSEYITEVA